MKARSFSLAGSISGKNGTRGSSSYSSSRLPFSSRFQLRRPPAVAVDALSFRRHQDSGQGILAVEIGKPSLFLQFAGAHHQNSIETSRQAGAVQYPDQAAVGHLLAQP